MATTMVAQALGRFPVVGLVGSRQVGKTTLAKSLAPDAAVYLDLELPSDLAKLDEPELYLEAHRSRLVVLDEVQRRPELFAILRGLIDRDRRPGRFLVLGSASPALLQQGAETLAGRIRYVELTPFLLPEVLAAGSPAAAGAAAIDVLSRLWVRGGYPLSYLADDEAASLDWRRAFVGTFLERDLPQLGIRIAAARMRRFWQMLAHWHGQTWNAQAFARNFEVSAQSVRHYLDVLTDARVVRQLQPRSANLNKRLVRSPKVYLRDSGLLHALLGIADRDALIGHPALGASFEGFAIEQVASVLGDAVELSFFATHTGGELDLVVELPGGDSIAIEAKYTDVPRLTRGGRQAVIDVAPVRTFVVTPSAERYPMGDDCEAIGLPALLTLAAAGADGLRRG